jgi:hypothetical protein
VVGSNRFKNFTNEAVENQEKAKVYYDKNAPAIIAQKREYNGRMREHINARQREYNKRERATRNNELLSLRSVQLIVLFEY